MKVYDLHDKEGRNFAFEIGNSFIDRSEVARIVKAIPGATLIKKPRTFSWVSEEEFCEWEINGVRFKAWEPFGDNSRYWIGPESAQSTPEIQMIKDAFLRHRPRFSGAKNARTLTREQVKLLRIANRVTEMANRLFQRTPFGAAE